MTKITRHEHNGILQGFSIYTPIEVVLLVHCSKWYYSIHTYIGHCDIGVQSADSQVTVFNTHSDATMFIANNKLLPLPLANNIIDSEQLL